MGKAGRVFASFGVATLIIATAMLPETGSAETFCTEAFSEAVMADTVKSPAAQKIAAGDSTPRIASKSAEDTARLRSAVDSVMKKAPQKHNKVKGSFVPDPKRALWLALVLPGAGQIYNRKYWKLPIFYGGFLGCTYALMWNQQMYKDYAQAYIDITDDDPRTASYENMLPPGYSIKGQEERFQTVFKNKKDRYRRWRDYAAFSFVGVYLLSVIDAYVDAQLSVFDISKDLSLNVRPAVISVHSVRPTSAVGIGCGFNF